MTVSRTSTSGMPGHGTGTETVARPAGGAPKAREAGDNGGSQPRERFYPGTGCMTPSTATRRSQPGMVPRLDARAATLVRFTGVEGALLRGEQAEPSNGLGEERSALQPPQHHATRTTPLSA